MIAVIDYDAGNMKSVEKGSGRKPGDYKGSWDSFKS